MSITMEKEKLLYISPIVVVTILIKYISTVKKNANPLFIIVLLMLIVLNYLAIYSFEKYFAIITLITCAYLVLYSVILKKYIYKFHLKRIISLSVIIGCLLVGYIIYSVIDLILSYIPEFTTLYVLLCAACLFIYAAISATIYLNNNYNNTVIILASCIATIFNIAISPINEFYFYNRTFTVLILTSHFLSIYLFMKFISETNPEDKKDIDANYF